MPGPATPGRGGPVSATATQEPAVPAGSWASSVATRKSMQGNTRRATAAELRVRRLLHARGLRYRVDLALPFDRRRRADITFTRARVVVFIDGCFWHGCPQHYVAPKSHAEYWSPKIAANRARDAQTTAQLQADRWTVLRFWEHEDPEEVAQQVADAVAAALAPPGAQPLAPPAWQTPPSHAAPGAQPLAPQRLVPRGRCATLWAALRRLAPARADPG